MEEYTNSDGTKFIIDSEEAPVPDDADYFGYLFKVRVANEEIDSTRVYKAIVKKGQCTTKEKASIWLSTTAIDFLKPILETYKDGKSLLLLPASVEWFVI